MKAPLRLSVVATLYQSASTLPEFHRRMSSAAAAVTPDFELILVDDGSTDASVEIARSLAAADPRVRVFRLSRNFGHHKAMMTGLAQARGAWIFLTDSDLEVAPEQVITFAEQLETSGADVVYGVQDERRDGWWDRVAGRVFYTTFNALSPHPLPPNLTTTRLMTRRYVSALLAHREQQTIIAGLWVLTGFQQVPRLVEKHRKRTTTYSAPRKIGVLVNAVTSFSDRPLILIFWAGLVIAGCAGVSTLALIVRRVVWGTVATGWLSLIVSTWLLGGLVLLSLGIVGLYVSRVFLETKSRPYTIIQDVYESEDGPT